MSSDSNTINQICDYNLAMVSVFSAVSILFFSVAILTMVMIVRDVLPILSPQDQNTLRNYWTAQVAGFRAWWNRGSAIGRAWSEHVRSFPKSRKRILFASFLIAGFISMFAYALWPTFGPR